MRNRIIMIVAAAIAIAATLPELASAQVASKDTTALTWARRLLRAMRSEEAFVKGIETGMSSQRQAANSQLPSVFFDSLEARFRRLVPELTDSIAPIYARLLSVAELKQLVEVYESPLGQHFAAAQGTVALETARMAEKWGARLALDVMRDLIDKGLMRP